MHLLYFFNRGCPQILHEKFESVPSANVYFLPSFPGFSIYPLQRQNPTMHFLYFFNRGCPQILHEKIESVPSANIVATPIFPFFPGFSIHPLQRQNQEILTYRSRGRYQNFHMSLLKPIHPAYPFCLLGALAVILSITSLQVAHNSTTRPHASKPVIVTPAVDPGPFTKMKPTYGGQIRQNEKQLTKMNPKYGGGIRQNKKQLTKMKPMVVEQDRITQPYVRTQHTSKRVIVTPAVEFCLGFSKRAPGAPLGIRIRSPGANLGFSKQALGTDALKLYVLTALYIQFFFPSPPIWGWAVTNQIHTLVPLPPTRAPAGRLKIQFHPSLPRKARRTDREEDRTIKSSHPSVPNTKNCRHEQLPTRRRQTQIACYNTHLFKGVNRAIIHLVVRQEDTPVDTVLAAFMPVWSLDNIFYTPPKGGRTSSQSYDIPYSTNQGEQVSLYKPYCSSLKYGNEQ